MRSTDIQKLFKDLKVKNGDKQLVVAVEELAELQKEISKGLRGKLNRTALAEELADVCIMANQVAAYYGITIDELKFIMNQKLNRTKKRLELDEV